MRDREGSGALVLFAHGSRDPQWADPLRALQRKLAAGNPRAVVELAFLELMEPTLAGAVQRLVESGRTQITIAPLFMAQGAHLKRDLAARIAGLNARHENVEIAVLPALGEVDEILDAMAAWLAKHV